MSARTADVYNNYIITITTSNINLHYFGQHTKIHTKNQFFHSLCYSSTQTKKCLPDKWTMNVNINLFFVAMKRLTCEEQKMYKNKNTLTWKHVLRECDVCVMCRYVCATISKRTLSNKLRLWFFIYSYNSYT
jgi:hypothetical protein